MQWYTVVAEQVLHRFILVEANNEKEAIRITNSLIREGGLIFNPIRDKDRYGVFNVHKARKNDMDDPQYEKFEYNEYEE